jgi:hypothetical protein
MLPGSNTTTAQDTNELVLFSPKIVLATSTGHATISIANSIPQHPRLSKSHFDLWHRRIGHINYQSLYHMRNRDLVAGTPRVPFVKHVCFSCMLHENKKAAPTYS